MKKLKTQFAIKTTSLVLLIVLLVPLPAHAGLGDFKLIPTVDLLTEVSLIGTVHVPADETDIPPAKPARSDRRKPGGESATKWLVAR